MMYEYVYLSSSHSDQESADRLVQELEAAGHKVWLGQDTGADAQQQRQTGFAIERSDAFILVLDPEALEGAGSTRELVMAQEAGKPIFLVKLQPVSLPVDVEANLAGRSQVDLSQNFAAGVERLLALLSGSQSLVGEGGRPGNFFGGEHFGRVPALPGEEIVWSESGLYWFKKWKTLVRIMVTQADRRLIFFWDERETWKWKTRELAEIEKAFPMTLSLSQITAVGEIFWPKSFLIFATGKPYVDVESAGGQRYRFSLQGDFEAHIDTLRETIAGGS